MNQPPPDETPATLGPSDLDGPPASGPTAPVERGADAAAPAPTGSAGVADPYATQTGEQSAPGAVPSAPPPVDPYATCYSSADAGADPYPTRLSVDAGVTATAPADWPARAGYEILGELGRGGMGVVYKARQLSLRRLVALKMIRGADLADSSQRARFRTEAEAVARLQHPNIVQIYEIGERNGFPFLALEFLAGGSLADRLKGTLLPAAEAAALVETLAHAMEAAHQEGIIHRDLKPANVLLGADGIPKISDFGLAKRLDDDSGQTRSGEIMGTPSYMAPEQALGKVREIGPLSDVYALGAILYEILTGRPPFRAATTLDTLEQVRSQEPVPPRHLQPKLPRDLETICLKCLHKEPARRYPNAAALADDLHRFRKHEPIVARPVGAWERGLKWARRRPLAAALVLVSALAVLSLLAAGAAYVRYQDQRMRFAERELDRELHERQRVEVLQAEAQVAILRGQNALATQDWQDARLTLIQALARVEREAALAPLRNRAADLLAEADRHLTTQAQLQEFRRLYGEALFQGSMSPEAHLVPNLEAIRASARKALAVFGIAADAGAALQPRPNFNDSEIQEITEHCYELLLVLAEAEAQSPNAARAGRALAVLDRAARLGIRTRAYHVRRAAYLRLQGDENAARREQEEADRLQPATALDFFLLGLQDYNRGRLPLAVHAFQNALRGPDHFWAQYFLSLCHLRLQQPELARANLTACLDKRPRFLWCYLLRAFAEAQLNEFATAERDFQTAWDLNQQAVPRPDPEAAYSVLVNRGVLRARQAQAVEAPARLARILPMPAAQGCGQVFCQLAHYCQERQYAAAVADLKEAIRIDPGRYQAFAKLAGVYQVQREFALAGTQFDQAIAVARQAIQTGKLSPSALALLYGQRARLKLAQDQLEDSLVDLDRAIQAPREDTASDKLSLAQDQAARGLVWSRQQRYREAVTAYDIALSLAPELLVNAYRWRAEALLQLRDYAAAVQSFDQYLERAKPEAEAYLGRGLAWAELRNYPRAIEDYTRALALRADPATYVARGWTYLANEAPRLAVRDFDAAIRRQPTDGDAYNGRGYARARLGYTREAVRDAEAALRHGPLTSRTLWNAARTYAVVLGRLDRDRGRRSDGDLAGRYYYQEQALQLLRRAVNAQPAATRPVFWRQVVEGDPVWLPLRGATEFQRLEGAYAAPADRRPARPK